MKQKLVYTCFKEIEKKEEKKVNTFLSDVSLYKSKNNNNNNNKLPTEKSIMN